jgi:hypothetical protein
MQYRYCHPKQIKTILDKTKTLNDNIVVVKDLECEIKQFGEEENRELEFVISTGIVDSDGDTLAVDGWDLSVHNKNPVVLWAHDRYERPPIGKASKTWADGTALRSIAQFLPPTIGDHEHVKFSDMIYRLFQAGYLKAVSVGFKPLEWTIAEDRSGWNPINYKRQLLLEYSAVPIPSNQEALLQARANGIDVEPMLPWAVKQLEQSPTNGLWIPKDKIQALIDTLKSVIVINTESAKEPVQPIDPTTSEEQSIDTQKAELVDAEKAASEAILKAQELRDAYVERVVKNVEDLVANDNLDPDLFKRLKSAVSKQEQDQPEEQDVLCALLDEISSLPVTEISTLPEKEDRPVDIFGIDPDAFADLVKSTVQQIVAEQMIAITGRLP